jgi:hypothetical protein
MKPNFETPNPNETNQLSHKDLDQETNQYITSLTQEIKLLSDELDQSKEIKNETERLKKQNKIADKLKTKLKLIIKSKEEKRPIKEGEEDIESQIKKAKEILKEENVIGPEISEELYDIELKDIPPISNFFTQEELQQAKERMEKGELREKLIFIPSNQTIESTQEALKEKSQDENIQNTGGLRSINDDIKNKHFNTQKTEARWVLASEPIQETQGKTAPVQLKIAVEKIKEMYGNNLPEKYNQAVEEFEKNFTQKLEEILDQSIAGRSDQEIDDLIHSTINDSKKRTQLTDWLTKEKIAKLITPNFSEFFAVFALEYQISQTEEEKDQLQKDYKDYSRIYQRVGSEDLAVAGDLASGGVMLGRWSPDDRGGFDFLSFVRSYSKDSIGSFSGEFFVCPSLFKSLIQPPSILPISRIFSSRSKYIFCSITPVSKQRRIIVFRIFSLTSTLPKIKSFDFFGLGYARKISSKISKTISSHFCPNVNLSFLGNDFEYEKNDK